MSHGIDADEYLVAGIRDGLSFTQIFEDMLPDCKGMLISDERRENLKNYWLGRLEGRKAKDICKSLGATYSDVSVLFGLHPCIRDMNALVEKLRAESILMDCEDAAYSRAVEGFAKNGKAYSDKMLEVLLRANNPEKYSPEKQDANSGLIVNFAFEGIERASSLKDISVDIEPLKKIVDADSTSA